MIMPEKDYFQPQTAIGQDYLPHFVKKVIHNTIFIPGYL